MISRRRFTKMKKVQSKHEQEQKFQRKLNHLQGFIGMPNWNLEKPSYHKTREYEQRAGKMQAETVGGGLKKMIKKIVAILMKTLKFKKSFYR